MRLADEQTTSPASERERADAEPGGVRDGTLKDAILDRLAGLGGNEKNSPVRNRTQDARHGTGEAGGLVGVSHLDPEKTGAGNVDTDNAARLDALDAHVQDRAVVGQHDAVAAVPVRRGIRDRRLPVAPAFAPGKSHQGLPLLEGHAAVERLSAREQDDDVPRPGGRGECFRRTDQARRGRPVADRPGSGKPDRGVRLSRCGDARQEEADDKAHVPDPPGTVWHDFRRRHRGRCRLRHVHDRANRTGSVRA
jgi:hypothetical protein